MIPANITIGFDTGKSGSDKTVVVVTRGTHAERSVWALELSPEQTSGMSDRELVGLALKRFADRLVDGDALYTTEAQNRGLPAHMLRVVVELDELVERIEKLREFIDKSPAFTGLPYNERHDLRVQHLEMTKLATVLNRRLERARNSNACS